MISGPVNAQCAQCGLWLGVQRQESLPGVPGPQYCIGCQTKRRATMILDALPEADGLEWNLLTEWEQSFLESVRQQFARKGEVSEKQYEVLERIWKKV